MNPRWMIVIFLSVVSSATRASQPPPPLVAPADSLAWLTSRTSRNLARSPGVEFSSPSESESGGLPPQAGDGDVTTAWKCKQQNATLQVSFPQPVRINGVFWECASQHIWAPSSPLRFLIEVSPDGVSWKTVAGEQSWVAARWATLFPALEVRSIRLTTIFTYYHIPVRVGELGVFLFDPVSTPLPDWWNPELKYRSAMDLIPSGRTREGLTTALVNLAMAQGVVTGAVLPASLRVVANGRELPAVFIPDADYNPQTRQIGWLTWREEPDAREAAHYLYFNTGKREEVVPTTPVGQWQADGSLHIEAPGQAVLRNAVPGRPHLLSADKPSWIVAPPREGLRCSARVGFDNFVREKPVAAAVEVANNGANPFTGELRISVVVEGRRTVMLLSRRVSLQPGDSQKSKENLDLQAVASGDCELVAQLLRGAQVFAESRRAIYIAPATPVGMGFGIYSIPTPGGLPGIEEGLRTAATMGFSVLQGQYWGGGYSYLHDRALRYGMLWQPTIEPIYNRNDLAAKDPAMALTGPDGKTIKAHPAACFTHPEVVKQTEAEAEKWLRDLVEFPGFCNRLLADDDVHLPDQACYNESCRSLFKQMTGHDAPMPDAVQQTKPGILPDDDPWVQWMLFRCSEVRGNLPRIYMRAKNRVCPQAVMGAVRGHMQMPFYTPLSGEYPPLFDAQYDVPGSYAYLYWVRPMQDYIVHGAWASMGNRGKDKWILGDCVRWFPWVLEQQADGARTFNLMKSLQWSDDQLVPYPVGAFRKEMWCMLAAGFNGIAMYEFDENGGPRDIRGTALEREIQSWGKRIERHGSMLKELREPTRPIAVLTSITTTAFEGWGHPGATAGIFKDCLREHLPVDMIAEEEIAAGGLKGRKALLLPGLNYLRRSVASIIEQYARQGGVVIVEDGAAVPIEGAVRVKRDAMVARAAAAISRDVECDNPRVLLREFECDGVRYYYIVNVYTDRWSPGVKDDPFLQGNNSVFAEPYRPRPENAKLRFPTNAGIVWDVFNNRQLPLDSAGNCSVELGEDDGVLIGLYPLRIARGHVTCEKSAVAGEVVHLTVNLLGATGQRVRGAVPVEIEVDDPRGVKSEYSGFKCVQGGALKCEFRTAKNDLPGTWQVVVKSLVGNVVARATFILKAG